jgi:hypothetical protein
MPDNGPGSPHRTQQLLILATCWTEGREVRISGSYDMCHCHAVTGVAGYVVVRIRTQPGPAVVT